MCSSDLLALLLGLMPPPATPGRNEPYAEQSSGVQAVVSDSGPLDLVAGHEQNQLRTVIEKLMGGPPDGPRRADYQRASPVSYVVAADTADGARTTPPLLLIYGVVDNQVNVSTADAFVTALGRSGHKDVSYFRLANVDHCPHSLVRIPYLRQVVVEFFQRTLKPSPAQGLQTCLLPSPATWVPRLWGCRPFPYHARPGLEMHFQRPDTPAYISWTASSWMRSRVRGVGRL